MSDETKPLRGHVGWSPDYDALRSEASATSARPVPVMVGDGLDEYHRRTDAQRASHAAAAALAEAYDAFDTAHPRDDRHGWGTERDADAFDDAVDDALAAYRTARTRARGETP